MSEPVPPHLTALNPEQLDAVTTTEGPLLVLAGAGSGKTRVLTRRVAHLLHVGVDPRHVLAVTFTNKAAAEMGERVVDLVGEAGRRVWVSTFHSTCARMLRADIAPLGRTRRFAIYNDDDQLRLVKQLVRAAGWDPKEVPPRGLLSVIDGFKNRLLDPASALAAGEVRASDRLVRVWRAYEEALRAADAVDFDDLIGMTVRLLEGHEAVREKWQRRFRYVLVDEYQDTNAAQYRLLKALVQHHRNLAVVGDDDQSIYGFRGADIRNILDFERDFPEAKVVRLEQNYRSTQHILDLANHVVAANTGRLDKRLWTRAEPGPKVHFKTARTPPAEAEWVVTALADLGRSRPWGDMAIIYRTNATSRPFEAALRRTSIPYRVVGGRKFYERREVRDVLAYLRLAANPADDAAFARVVNVPSRGIGAKTVAEVRAVAAEEGEPLLAASRTLSRQGTNRRHRALGAFATLVDELARESSTREPWDLVRLVLERTGYRAALEAEGTDEAADRLANLDELVRDAGDAVGEVEGDAVERLHAWLDRVALAGADEELPAGGMVSLLTVHNAKGLEFPVVFVAHMVEGQFPHARSADTPEEVEEERRLAYVAFTRAMHRLVITRHRVALVHAGQHTTERSVTPSRFLYGLPAASCTGDVPRAPGVRRAHPPAPRDRAGARLAAFVQRRSAQRPAPAPAPADEHTLVDLEDASQLVVGVRVYHPRHGVGVIKRVLGSGSSIQLRVSFGGHLVLLPVGGARLQIVVE